jgi:hypothetical protein
MALTILSDAIDMVVDNASTCPHRPFERFGERALSEGKRVMRNSGNSYHERCFENVQAHTAR